MHQAVWNVLQGMYQRGFSPDIHQAALEPFVWEIMRITGIHDPDAIHQKRIRIDIGFNRSPASGAR